MPRWAGTEPDVEKVWCVPTGLNPELWGSELGEAILSYLPIRRGLYPPVLPPAQGLACPTEYGINVALATASPSLGNRLPQDKQSCVQGCRACGPLVASSSLPAFCLVCTAAEGPVKYPQV